VTPARPARQSRHLPFRLDGPFCPT
jgi:hypothetical protein